jgi:UDP-3-O-[3-hydroxymyristoyl] N-acetylglucosamine deacetylase
MYEVELMRKNGLGLGGNLNNAIVLDEDSVLNEGGLRFPDEFVRHKILDAIGDLALLGAPFVGDYTSFAGSHHLNHELTKAIFRDPNNYEIKTLSRENAYEFEKVFA